MASFQFFHSLLGNLGRGLIDLNGHTFKAVLSNAAPSAADGATLADVIEIAEGNGYAAGGVALAVTWSESAPGSGLWIWLMQNFHWVAAGGSIGPFQYVVIYDDTAAGDPLVGFLDFGAPITVPGAYHYLVDYDEVGPIQLRIAA
nr:hypothetical protein DBT53_13370 [Aerococcus mictus]